MINAKLRELFGIDIRSLALFRMGLAIILLVDLFIRFQDLGPHYSDEGVLPRHVLLEQFSDLWNISLHLVNGTWQIQFIFFLLAGVFALALLIGYQTRLATILSWFFLISLHSRNPMILQGGDIVLRVLLFWSLFLPLNSCWSIDRWLNNKNAPYTPSPSSQIFSAATFALLLQICFIYWFAALLKTDVSWRQNGTAVWYALSNELFATSSGLFLLQFPLLLKTLTFSTFYLEIFGPFLAFSPIFTGPLRFITVICFILFHVSLNLTMELGHFSYVCIVAWLVFLPEWFWNHVLVRARGLTSQETLQIPWKASRLSNGLAIFFIAYIFLWNVNTLNIPLLSSPLSAIGPMVRIDQYWNMFSPFPLREDGWYVIPGQLRDGTEVDLFSEGGPVCWEKTGLLSKKFKNDRWKSYMMNLSFADKSEINLSCYAKYLCRQWNAEHSYSKQLVTFEIIFMSKTNELKNPPQAYKKAILWHHQCF